MDQEEKKISLDELPDEDKVEAVPEMVPRQNFKEALKEPRITKLKKLDTHEQVVAMGRKWYFDRPERSWGWLIALVILLVLENINLYDRILLEQSMAEELTMGLSGAFTDLILMLTFIVKHPFYLAPLIPLIFKFQCASLYFFELSFDGIDTVVKIQLAKGEMVARIKLKWNEIIDIKKSKANYREILELYSPEGKVGELIWDLDNRNKKAIKQLVKGLLLPSNPFRVFIEKEVI